jgi:2-desacetyl-2-hydroxyethyl bacteriochlorophyllide A dehydrogenase
MNAAVLRGVRKISLEEMPIPSFKPTEVLVSVRSTAICGSDLHGFEGLIPQRRPIGLIMGHEFSGVIEKVGSQVSNLKPGDRVAIDPQVSCGTCFACAQGWRNLCDSVQVVGSAMRGYRHGANAEYVAVPAENAYVLPSSVSFPEAALAEPAGNAIHLIRRVGVQKGSNVVIIGAGAIGSIAVQVAKAYGAKHVTVIEPSRFKRELAERLGANVVINPKEEDVEAIVRKNTDGLGAEIILECCGVTATYQLAVRLARKRGVIGALGYVDETISFPMRPIIFNELSLVGSTGFYWPVDPALEMISSGRLNLSPLITHQFQLAQAQDAYETAGHAEAIKVIINS